MGWPREKITGKSYFWEKILIIDNKQTEKVVMAKVKKLQFRLKPEKSYA